MTRFVLVSTLLGVLVAGAAAQSPEGGAQPPASAAQAPVFRSGASLVALNVTVTDAEKRFVTGLTSEDFAVYEDGVQQQVRVFEASQVPIDLILLLDCSSSMQDKIDTAQRAAMGFLKTLRPTDRGAVVAFSDGVDVIQSLTSDSVALEGAVRRTQARGGTALHNALYVALKQFGGSARASAELRRRAIAVFSDGEDTSSVISFDDVLDQARRAGVSIYTVGLQSRYAAAAAAAAGRRYFSQSQYEMKTLAVETGAQSFFPSDIVELNGVYASIARELSNQYSIGYSPANTRADGRFRRIVVRVVSRPELKPKARTGYTAASTSVASVSHGAR